MSRNPKVSTGFAPYQLILSAKPHLPMASKQHERRSAGLGSVFKSLKKSLTPALGTVPVIINAKVVGGGDDMQKLLLQLQHGNLQTRAAAVVNITESLEKYSISSVPEVWSLARDLCDRKTPDNVRRDTLRLLIQCIRQKGQFTSDNLWFYSDIVHFCTVSESRLDPDFDLFLEALRCLTNDGRDIHEFYIHHSEPTFAQFVHSCFSVLSRHAKEFFREDTLESVKEEKNFCNLQNMTGFIANCFKYSFSSVDESFVASILSRLVLLAMSTGNIPILSSYLDLIQTVLAFGYIPLAVYDSVIELVCVCDSTHVELQSICREIHKQYGFEKPFIVFRALARILQNPNLPNTPDMDEGHLSSQRSKSPEELVPIAAFLGALVMVERVSVNVAVLRETSELYISMARFVSALLENHVYENAILNSALLATFDRLFNTDNSKELYAQQVSFSDLFPFQLWFTTSSSMIDILSRLHVNNIHDQSKWASICRSLLAHLSSGELVAPKDAIIDIFLRFPDYLEPECCSYVLEYFEKERLSSSGSSWQESCKTLLTSFYKSSSVSSELRINTLNAVKNSYLKSVALLNEQDWFRNVLVEIFQNAKNELDLPTLEYLAGDYLCEVLQACSFSLFQAILRNFSTAFVLRGRPEKAKSIVSLGSVGSSNNFARVSLNRQMSYSRLELTVESSKETRGVFFLLLARSLSKMLIVCSVEDAEKAAECYHIVIEALDYFLKNDFIEPLIVLLKSLGKLRVNCDGYVYFTKTSDMGGLAGAFKRNRNDSTFDQTKEMLWSFPETNDYIPEQFLDKPGQLRLFDANATRLLVSQLGVIDIRRYLELCTTIMEEFVHWEVYSFVWTHYCSQLSNMTLFAQQTEHIRQVQQILCEQLTLNLPKSLVFPASNTKGDLQVAHTRTLSSLAGYHEFFTKQQQDQIVGALLFAMGSFEKTAIPCIHILNVCCYDMPSSIKKYLTPILIKLQTGMTSTFASSPTLEFLMSLVDLPTLTLNFTLDDFKRVLAIAFKYIQFALDQKTRLASQDTDEKQIQQHGVDAEVEQKISTQTTKITPLVNEYVSVLAYLTVSKWFLAISMNERKHLSSFAVRSLIQSNMLDQLKAVQERTIAFTDLLMRFAFSDMPLKVISSRSTSTLENVTTGTWLMGYSLITVSTDITTGESTIKLRRPSGTTVFSIQLDPQMFPLDYDDYGKKHIVTSPYFLLQLLNHIDIDDSFKPIPLPEDAATERALASLDRTPPVLFHKAGIIYIGPGQSDESEILGNQAGSTDYHNFLDRIGQLVKLKQADSIYVGGLDKENGTDGEYAYYWSDKVLQLIFHTTTMMPNSSNDRFFGLKKRHIGNNYVNVYFDESGLPFNFNVIKLQFNFLNIVISPHTTVKRLFRSESTKVYRVKTFRRSGVPGLFSTTHFKMVSAEQLPNFIRNQVLISDRFAQVWHNYYDGEYVMNWQRRVKQIVALRQKIEQPGPLLPGKPAQDVASVDMTRSFLEQLQGTGLGQHVNAGDKYSMLEFNSYT